MVWWVETKKSNSRQDKNFNFSKFSRQDISRICQTNSRQDKTLIGWKFQDKTRQDSRSCQEIIKTSRQEISRPTPGSKKLWNINYVWELIFVCRQIKNEIFVRPTFAFVKKQKTVFACQNWFKHCVAVSHWLLKSVIVLLLTIRKAGFLQQLA